MKEQARLRVGHILFGLGDKSCIRSFSGRKCEKARTTQSPSSSNSDARSSVMAGGRARLLDQSASQLCPRLVTGILGSARTAIWHCSLLYANAFHHWVGEYRNGVGVGLIEIVDWEKCLVWKSTTTTGISTYYDVAQKVEQMQNWTHYWLDSALLLKEMKLRK